jgi:hypothetical protein
MSKRGCNDVMGIAKKFKSNIECEYNTSENMIILQQILVLLENISSRLDQCEKGIQFLTDCKIKEEQEKLAKKLHDEEIFRSYIN